MNLGFNIEMRLLTVTGFFFNAIHWFHQYLKQSEALITQICFLWSLYLFEQLLDVGCPSGIIFSNPLSNYHYFPFDMWRIFLPEAASRSRCSVKKGILRNFVKFTGKHPCQSLFFNEVAGPGTSLKKKL